MLTSATLNLILAAINPLYKLFAYILAGLGIFGAIWMRARRATQAEIREAQIKHEMAALQDLNNVSNSVHTLSDAELDRLCEKYTSDK